MLSSIHVLGSRRLGGAESFYMRLVEALTRAGHPTLAVTRRNGMVAGQLASSVRQIHLPLASRWDVYSRWKLGRLIAAERPAIVQTYMGRATRLTRLHSGSRSVHVARLGGFYKIAGYYEHADAWVGNTRSICDYLQQQGMPAERVFHIGNFVPSARAVVPQEITAWRQRLNLPPDAKVLFALGRLIEKKGFQDLLDAFAALSPTVGGQPLVLVIAGDGNQRARLDAQTQALGLAARVHWVGWQADPAALFALADAFVCPSRHEPLGNVILEAWSHRLPVLSTRNDGARELIVEHRNGLLAPTDDPKGLADGLRALLSLPESAGRALGDAGHGTLERDHGERAVVDAYLNLYERLRRPR